MNFVTGKKVAPLPRLETAGARYPAPFESQRDGVVSAEGLAHNRQAVRVGVSETQPRRSLQEDSSTACVGNCISCRIAHGEHIVSSIAEINC